MFDVAAPAAGLLARLHWYEGWAVGVASMIAARRSVMIAAGLRTKQLGDTGCVC
jgi:hypothetical protein